MGRGDGRKVFDIEWEKEGHKIKVPVRMKVEEDNVTGEDKMTFRAVYKEADIEESHTDANELRKAVTEKLDLWYTVDWELWFRVTIDGNGDGAGQSSFSISYTMEFYLIGKDCKGEERHLKIPRPDDLDIKKTKPPRWGGRGHAVHSGRPETGEVDEENRRWRYGNESQTKSLVKATPQNVAASDNFIKSMEQLLDKMHHHFAPQRIERLLARTSNILSFKPDEEEK